MGSPGRAGADVDDHLEVGELESLRGVGVTQLRPHLRVLAHQRERAVHHLAELLGRLEALIARRSLRECSAVTSRPVTGSTIHLHPTAPLAERVLLPGDPGRALLLAQSLLDAPGDVQPQPGAVGLHGRGADGSR